MKRFGFVVEMGADDGRSEEQIEDDLLKIPGVLDAFLEEETGEGEVTISGIADAATLKPQLETSLKKPVKILFEVPIPPVEAGYQPYPYGAMQQPPPPHVPWSPILAQPIGPYVRYNQPPHSPPPPPPGYYHTPYYGGRPYNFKDDYDHGCSCSIQ